MKLTPIERGVFKTTIENHVAVIAFRRRNRQSKETLNSSVTFSGDQIKAARKWARDLNAEGFVATEIMLNGTWQKSAAVPLESWNTFHTGSAERPDFPVSDAAFEKYKKDEECITGFRVEELAKPKESPAPKAPAPKPAAPESSKPTAWTPEEEKEIARLQETRGISRKSAIQAMRRAAKARS